MSEDINVGAISEALNDKIDRDGQNVDTVSGADMVIESQEPTEANGYTWYRLYKSGWVEQGGRVTGGFTQSISWSTRTVTLVVPMVDNSYIGTFQATWNYSFGGQTGQDKVYATTESTTTAMNWQYILLSSSSAMFVNWMIQGMSAR